MSSDAAKRWLKIRPRDVWFFALGTGILFHEVWLEEDPSALGVFLVIFFYGLIPAFKADEGSVGPKDILIQMLGGSVSTPKPPDPPKPSEPPPAPPERKANGD